MLKKILSGDTCASCQICCAFFKDELWEMPSVSDELKTLIKEKYNIDTDYHEFNGSRVFWSNFDEKGLMRCPMLSENGCVLGDDKPFECKVWPFRSMRITDKENEKIVLTVSPLCSSVSKLPKEQLEEFANIELKDAFIKMIQKEPKLIKPYIEDYPIILEL